MKEKLWRAAFAQTLPVLAGYLFLGFAYGVLMRRAGFSTLWAVGLSLCIYAGSMQYAAVPPRPKSAGPWRFAASHWSVKIVTNRAVITNSMPFTSSVSTPPSTAPSSVAPTQ